MANKNDLFDKYKAVDESGDDNNFNLTLLTEDEETVIPEDSKTKTGKKEKKTKEPKPVKEKKIKEPKPVKDKKTKEPRALKENKAKKSAKENKDLPFEEQLTKKDHITFALVLFTLVVAIAFVCIKFIIPLGNDEVENPTPVIKIENISKICTHKEDVSVQYLQSDIKDVFYSWSPENAVQYYQYDDKKLKAISPFGNTTAKVKMAEEELSVSIEYVKVGDSVFGIGLFSVDQIEEESAYKKIVLKMTDLPVGYKEEGKALLLATVETGDTLGKYSRWTDSFVVEIESGKTTRFLANSKTDVAEAVSYSVLSDEAYMMSDGKIPFFTTRNYEAISGKRDIFIKDGSKEYVVAEDVYGNYVFIEGGTIIYLKSAESGFNVVKKDSEDEIVVFNLSGDLNANYLCYNEFLLNKNSGKLYNVKTGAEIQIKDYKMLNPESISVSADGKNLVVLGTEKSIVDYKLYIVNPETGECIKYEDTNISKHTDVMFINDTVLIYTAVSPEKGYENVIVDIAKANKK